MSSTLCIFKKRGFDRKRWKWDCIQSDERGARYKARRTTFKAPRGTRSEAISQRSEKHPKLQKPNTTNQTMIFERNQKPTIHIPEAIGVPVLLKVLSPPKNLHNGVYVHRIPPCKNYETPNGCTCTCEDAIQSRRGTYKSTKTRRGGTRTGTTPGKSEELDYAHTSFTLTGARTKEHYFLV